MEKVKREVSLPAIARRPNQLMFIDAIRRMGIYLQVRKSSGRFAFSPPDRQPRTCLCISEQGCEQRRADEQA